jgi:hypothetical protein
MLFRNNSKENEEMKNGKWKMCDLCKVCTCIPFTC